MLFGTNAWEINFSHSRGFFMVCAGCGTNNKIEMLPVLSNQVEGEYTTRPYQLYVIIECKHCDQIVHVLPDGTSVMVKESNYES